MREKVTVDYHPYCLELGKTKISLIFKVKLPFGGTRILSKTSMLNFLCHRLEHNNNLSFEML